jgi:hypothetical protein
VQGPGVGNGLCRCRTVQDLADAESGLFQHVQQLCERMLPVHGAVFDQSQQQSLLNMFWQNAVALDS